MHTYIGSLVTMKVGIISALALFSIITVGDGLECYQCPKPALGTDHVCMNNIQGTMEKCDEDVEFCYLKTDTAGIFLN